MELLKRLVGLLGDASLGILENCYAIGKVKVNAEEVSSLIGGEITSIENCYASPEASEVDENIANVARSVQEMLYQNNYENWDFDTIWAIEPNGGSFPFFKQSSSTLEITKKIADSQIPLKGAKIAIYDEWDNILKGISEKDKIGTTDASGKVIFTTMNLEEGNYYYKEVEAPEGYELNDEKYYFSVDNAGVVTLAEGVTGEIYDEPTKIYAKSIEIQKLKTGTTTPVKGAKIGLCTQSGSIIKDNSENNAVMTTDENGKVDFASIVNLEPGTYYYKEVEAPAGYIQNTKIYSFKVKDDGTVTFNGGTNGIIYNARVTAQSGTAVIKKYKTGTTTPVQGAKIGMCDNNGNVLTVDGKEISGITNENGKIDFTQIVNMEPGTYYYKEIEAPAGYIKDTKIYSFEVNNDGTVTFNGGTNGIIYNEQNEKLYLRSNVYTIDEKYLSRVSPKTTVEEFIKKCESNGTIEIFDQNGNKLNSNDIVGTGMTVRATKDDEKIELKISVIGDLNGNGKVTLTDIARAELAYIGNIELENEYKLSADINNDGKQTLTDIAKLEQYVVGLIEL